MSFINSLFLWCFNLSSKLAFKSIMRDIHHPVNELWPPLGQPYKIQIMTYVQSIYPSIYNTNVIYIVHSHSSNHPNSKEENIIFTSYPTFNFVVFESSHILLKQTNPSSYIFTIELYYACKRHIIKHVNDNGFNIPQHQG